MLILGINAYHGDVSAALIRDGQLVAAVEEERFRRIKHWAGFPLMSIQSCLEMAGAKATDIDHIAVSRNPKANLPRKVLFALRNRPNRSLVMERVRNSSRVQDLPTKIAEDLGLDADRVKSRMHWVEHHPAHLASAFFVSPFDQAAVCAIDGFGDFVSTSTAIGRGNQLDVVQRVFFPHSLGLVYLAVTQYLGFMKYGDEYKVMGLAPYGQVDFANEIKKLFTLTPGGGFELDLSYFCHWTGESAMTWEEGEPKIDRVFTSKMEQLLGPTRKPEEPVTPRHEAIAASLQRVFEEAAFHVLNGVYQKTKMTNLCLAGGCAMNSVANGKIRANTPFRDIYIQPAAGDNGTAVGAAYYVWNQILKQPRGFRMEQSYWGPEFKDADIQKALNARAAELEQKCTTRHIVDEDELCEFTAGRIADSKVIGWYQGRMEWASRALGNRSILADPRRADMREIINLKIKFRERFRPFAPSIMEEAIGEYFVDAVPDPFMIQVYPVRPDKRASIPAVTHVDGSGRLQTVSMKTNLRYWKLIRAFKNKTGVPILLNTSFNENEPIVLRPEEALDCFLRTDMDVLALGNHIVEKR